MRTLLIDGDMIAFTVAARVETKIAWGDGVDTREADHDTAVAEINSWIAEMLTALEADAAIVAVGDPSRRYFRHDLYPDYKLDRTHGTPPLLLKAMKSYLQDDSHKTSDVPFTPKMKPGLEADDVLGILGVSPDARAPAKRSSSPPTKTCVRSRACTSTHASRRTASSPSPGLRATSGSTCRR